MKRENFEIKFNGNVVIKHKWNSAIKEVENLIREIARTEQTIYELVESVSTKIDAWHFGNGVRVWKGRNNKTVSFTITKI